MLVFWLAHVYADTLARSIDPHEPSNASFGFCNRGLKEFVSP